MSYLSSYYEHGSSLVIKANTASGMRSTGGVVIAKRIKQVSNQEVHARAAQDSCRRQPDARASLPRFVKEA